MRSGTSPSFTTLAALCAIALAAPAAAAAHVLIGPPLPAFASEPEAAFAEPHVPAQPESAPEAIAQDEQATAAEEPDSAPAPLPATEKRPLGAEREKAKGFSAGAMGDSIAGNWVGRTIFALAIVLGVAVLCRGLVRKAARSGGGLLGQLGPGGRAPSGLLMVLARYPVGRGQTLVLLKLDSRVLLTCQTADGFRTLTEIADPDEVASILIKSRDEEGDTIAHRFNQILHDVERDPSVSGDGSLSLASGAPTTPRGAFTLRDDPPAADADTPDPVGALRKRLASLSELRA